MFGPLSCRKYMSWAVRYLTGDLEPEAHRAEFERHITRCERCRAAVAERRRQLQELLSGTHAPEDIKDALTELGLRPSGSRIAGWAMAGALVVVLFVTAYVWRLANPLDGLLGTKASNVLPIDTRKVSAGAAEVDNTKGGGLVENPKRAGPKPKPAVSKPSPKPAESKPVMRKPKPEAAHVVKHPVRRHRLGVHRLNRKHPIRPRRTTEVEVLGAGGKVVGHSGKTVSGKEH